MMKRYAVLALVALAALAASTGVVRAHLAARHVAAGHHMGMPVMGPKHWRLRPVFLGYYDGHKDVYINTDSSNQADAKMMGVNFAPGLRSIKMHSLPEIYLVEGRSAPGQLAIFGSEPGEKTYSPLWHETLLTWKSNATPVVIKSDTQINAIEKKGTLTERDGMAILNCPIVKVGKGKS